VELDHGADGDPVADRELRHVVGHRGDHARDLVTGGHGAHRHGREPLLVLEEADVRVAQATCLDVDQHLSGLELGFRDLLVAERFVRVVEAPGLHAIPL